MTHVTHPMSTLDRFELPDLLVTLCEAGQTSLAARIARTLLGAQGSGSPASRPQASPRSRAGATRQARDLRERAAKDCGVARHEPHASSTIQALQDDLEPTRNGR